MGSYKNQDYFELNTKNSLEIKQKSKTLVKIKSSELLNENVLFPIFQSVYTLPNDEQSATLEIIQIETGMFCKYIYENDVFDINDLNFLCEKFENKNALTEILFKNNPLLPYKTDTVVRMNKIIVYKS